MNKLRLTNVIENHFYLDFNWKGKEMHKLCLMRRIGVTDFLA